MAKKKKFFNTKVKNRRKKMTKLIIIGVSLIILIIVILVLVLINLPKKPEEEENLLIKKEVSIEINETPTDQMFFTKNDPNLDSVTMIYPDNFNTSEVGTYEITINVAGEKYTSKLNVIDTTSPELTIKELRLDAYRRYAAIEFVENCSDNSKKDCQIEFYQDGVNENGEKIDYEKFDQPGTYDIKIIATDASGNETIKSAKLIIGANNSNESKTCEFGNADYDSTTFIMTSSVSNNDCAINPKLYNDESITKNVNKLLATETIKIKKDLNNLNLDGTIALNRTINVIMNKSNNGLVGYELVFTATLTKDSKSNTIAEYKIDNNSKRIFSVNTYELAN